MGTDYHRRRHARWEPGGRAYAPSVDDDGGYSDPRLTCTPTGIDVHGYYFPWGTKRIPYGRIRSLERSGLGPAADGDAPRGPLI